MKHIPLNAEAFVSAAELIDSGESRQPYAALRSALGVPVPSVPESTAFDRLFAQPVSPTLRSHFIFALLLAAEIARDENRTAARRERKAATDKTRVRVNVTARDISDGIRQSPWRCAVSRAVARALKSNEVAVIPDVSGMTGAITDKTRGTHYAIPARVCEFVRSFDSGKPVRPFRFRLIPAL